jgi:hypothetical protein
MSLGRFRFVLCAKLGGILPVASLLLPAQKRSQQVHDTRRLWSEARAAPRLMSGTISRHRGDSGRCAVWKSGAGCGGGDKHRPALASDARSAAPWAISGYVRYGGIWKRCQPQFLWETV